MHDVKTDAATGAAMDSAWSGGAPPFAMGSKKLGMWLFIVSDTLTFSVLLITYTYSRLTNPDWPKPFPMNPAIIFSTTMTVVLLASSLTMVMAVMAAQRNDRKAAVLWIIATMAGGLSFMGLHLREWFHLFEERATITHNPWGTPQFGRDAYDARFDRRHLSGNCGHGLRARQIFGGRCRGERTVLALCGPGLDVRVPADLFDVGEILDAFILGEK